MPQMTPLDLIVRELSDFLDAVKTRRKPEADAFSSGLALASFIEAIYRSAKSGHPQRLKIHSVKTRRLEVAR